MLNLTDCPLCGLELQVPTDLLGHRVKCPSCMQLFLAPSAVTEIRPPKPPPMAIAVPKRRFCCPYCQSNERPMAKSRIHPAGWAAFVVLLIAFFPLCWIGLLIKERGHVCYDCGIRLD